MFVLIHNQDNSPQSGLYVAKPGRDKSYTPRLEHADVFKSREQAQAHRCVDSERIVAVADILAQP